MLEEEFTVQQLGRIFSVGDHSITNWAGRGAIIGRRIGFGQRRRWAFSLSSVLDFIGRQEMTASERRAIEEALASISRDQERIRQGFAEINQKSERILRDLERIRVDQEDTHQHVEQLEG